MESKAKLAGHAIHPMLIVFPLGLLVTSVILDIAYMVTGNEVLATVAWWNIGIGIVTGLLAAIFGFIDWQAIPKGTRAERIGRNHGIGNVVLLVLFSIVWFLRREDPAHLPGTLPMVLEIAALLLGTVTAWLGGELVERLAVGVDRGAHLDAPSSLSGEAASPAQAPTGHTKSV